MRFHWLRLRATAHATEDPERVRRAMQTVSGLDDEAFAAATDPTAMESQHGGAIVWLETNVTRSADVRQAVSRLLSICPPGIADELEARTDDEGVFYLRFDKQAAFQGTLKPTRGDDAIQVRIRPQVHPASRAGAIAAVAEALAADRV